MATSSGCLHLLQDKINNGWGRSVTVQCQQTDGCITTLKQANIPLVCSVSMMWKPKTDSHLHNQLHEWAALARGTGLRVLVQCDRPDDSYRAWWG
jgi:hypothetical protein